MRRRNLILALFAVWAFSSIGGPAEAVGDARRGEQVFQACVACHSLKPGRHMTGPSLAGIWGQKAGSVEGFARYSDVLKSADVEWDAGTLDAWLKKPSEFIPRNRMIFPGIPEPQAREDLIAYLQAVAGPEGGSPQIAEQPSGMGGGMMSSGMIDLKAVAPAQQVKAIRYCGDTYTVTTEAGETVPLWEFNLRFKTDSGENGPPAGHPVLLPGGMMGDRAFIVFASPREISAFIEAAC